MEESDCVVVMGSNMAENHPVAFRWPMKAQVQRRQDHPRRPALHAHERDGRHLRADPRRARTSRSSAASSTTCINNERWNSDPFFREYLVNYTNAATIITAEFKDTEELDGVFSGLMEYTEKLTEWPYNGFIGQYDNADLAVRGHRTEARRAWIAGDPAIRREQRSANATRLAATRGCTEQDAAEGAAVRRAGRSLLKPPPQRDETLKNPRTVFQILKRHFARYTPEMVERVTGCPQESSSRWRRPSWPTPAATARRRSRTRWRGRSTRTARR